MRRFILDHWEMRSIRNSVTGKSTVLSILDHWEMRSIRNSNSTACATSSILDHWEMRSIRNLRPLTQGDEAYFRSLGNALYPELARQALEGALDFRSLGNALYPEL